MQEELIELKKVYFKLSVNVSYQKQLNDMGHLPFECCDALAKDIRLMVKLENLINDFGGL